MPARLHNRSVNTIQSQPLGEYMYIVHYKIGGYERYRWQTSVQYANAQWAAGVFHALVLAGYTAYIEQLY